MSQISDISTGTFNIIWENLNTEITNSSTVDSNPENTVNSQFHEITEEQFKAEFGFDISELDCDFEMADNETPSVEYTQKQESENSNMSNQTKKRFKSLKDEDLQRIEGNVYSDATKKNTKWGINVFKAWCSESIDKEVDLATIPATELSQYLRQFYAEAAPKESTVANRAKIMNAEQAAEYHKNSLKNVRAAINRYLKDVRDIDIVRDKEFDGANKMLSGKLKPNLRQGLSKPVKHYPVIEPSDLKLINAYLKQDDPVALRFKVWFNLCFHFVSRGVEFHHQLKLDSLEFCTDESGREYIKLSHETMQKNHQGGISQKSDETPDKRMYATGGVNCPLESVRKFISKTDPTCTTLFNQCNPESFKNPSSSLVWYIPKPVKVKQFSQFMPDICKNAGCKRYTAHSIRATAIQGMDDAGFETRSITFMSDHKRDESIKSYARQLSTGRKQQISDALAGISGSNPHPLTPHPTNIIPVNQQIPLQAPAVVPHPSSLVQSETNWPVVHESGPVTINSQTNSDSRKSGFAPNASFYNCTFNFSGGF